VAKRAQRAIPEVPKAIFDQFLKELERDPMLFDVSARLKAVLLENEALNETAIRSALLPDDHDSGSS
jgi:hypothetical protein